MNDFERGFIQALILITCEMKDCGISKATSDMVMKGVMDKLKEINDEKD